MNKTAREVGRRLAANRPWLRTVGRWLLAPRGTSGLRKTFRHIYQSGTWGGVESSSGWGSDLASTERVRRKLPEILASIAARTLLDAPCGDFNWMREVDLKGVRYVGLDIVPEVILENRRRFAGAARCFQLGDITRSELPRADLILCRDCLVHLSFRDSLRAVANFKKAGRFLLTTTFPGNAENLDIVTGGWRPLDLEKPPFNFPPPLRCETEVTPSLDPVARTKSLGLWKIEDL